MKDHGKKPPDQLTIQVALRDDPVSQVIEEDAYQASRRYPKVVVRGPVFGFAEQRPQDGERWRLLSDMNDGFAQAARDELNSYLWFRAKDDTDDRVERRQLLDAVEWLETEAVDELTVGGVRYRIVRGDEFARSGAEGLEGPRPTDPESLRGDSERCSASRTKGFVIDHSAATGVMESIQRVELLPLTYKAARIPSDVRADSRYALETHPGVVLLPATFTFAERRSRSWEPLSTPLPTPQDARRSLVNYLRDFLPRLHRLSAAEAAQYARAAEEYRLLPRCDELRVRGRRFRIIRVERLIRIGPDGPEPPRASDVDPYPPARIHLRMDEWGNVLDEE